MRSTTLSRSRFPSRRVLRTPAAAAIKSSFQASKFPSRTGHWRTPGVCLGTFVAVLVNLCVIMIATSWLAVKLQDRIRFDWTASRASQEMLGVSVKERAPGQQHGTPLAVNLWRRNKVRELNATCPRFHFSLLWNTASASIVTSYRTNTIRCHHRHSLEQLQCSNPTKCRSTSPNAASGATSGFCIDSRLLSNLIPTLLLLYRFMLSNPILRGRRVALSSAVRVQPMRTCLLV